MITTSKEIKTLIDGLVGVVETACSCMQKLTHNSIVERTPEIDETEIEVRKSLEELKEEVGNIKTRINSTLH